MMKKPWTPLTLIQIAWVVEAALVLANTVVAWWLRPADDFREWLASVPILAALITGQGAAASIGPLVSDKIKAGLSAGISAIKSAVEKKDGK